MSTLALDIGGANVKWAHDNGAAGGIAFALWQKPEALVGHVKVLLAQHPCDTLLVTMTAELCDCFNTRREGVTYVLDAVQRAVSGQAVWAWTTDAQFVEPARAQQQPMQVAAANWHALATATAQRLQPAAGVLIDVGSTTSDVIPFHDGTCAARGMTDTARLRTGELVYLGVDRTPLMAVASSVTFQGERIGVMAEHFATMADVMVLTGLHAPQPGRTDTADGRALTKKHAAARVLRMIGSDRDAHTEADAVELAGAFLDAASARLCDALRSVLRIAPAPEHAVISGSGEALAKRAAQSAMPGTPCESLRAQFGEAASRAACAHAMLLLWGNRCRVPMRTS